jgi:hypothetical protein
MSERQRGFWGWGWTDRAWRCGSADTFETAYPDGAAP